MAREPDGCVETNFLSVNFFLLARAMLKASPKQANIVELEVGANKEPASVTLGNKILILEIVGIILFGPETADLGCFRVPVREDATLRPHNEKSSVQKHRGEEV